jgi:hypothetical protein
MATIASGVPTLLDVVGEIAPDGSQFDTAEVLTQTNAVLEDMTWMAGNLLTGHRDSVRTVLPEPSFRKINQGVPYTKGASTQIEESCAMLEDFSKVDRELAILSGNVNAYRLKQAKPHQIGMAHKFARTLFYGNDNVDTESFTGLAPRYATLNKSTSNTANYVIDAGGTGSGLRSVWLIGWSHETITGLYPKNTIGGLHHEDATNASGSGADGMPAAAVLYDNNGLPFMGYQDHWVWRCGLLVKDYRYAVRIANIDLDTLNKNPDTAGADLSDLMVQALERIEMTAGVNLVFYAPRDISSFLRRQILSRKQAYLSWDEVAGKKVMMFGEAPVKRVDALNVEETQVV